MIDLHIHIMPGVDDGSPSMEESVKMAWLAVRSGVHTMTATPHCNIPGEVDNYDGSQFRENLRALQQEMKRQEIPLTIYSGMEVFGTPQVPSLLDRGKLTPLNDGKYLLIEFAFEEDLDMIWEVLEGILQRGYTPLIAHPERYFYVGRDPQIAYEWNQMGCRLQMNKGSILGRFGERIQRVAMDLLDHELIACVASDAHSSWRRTPYMTEARDVLEEEFGPDCPVLLMEENPKRILNSKEVYRLRPYGFHGGFHG